MTGQTTCSRDCQPYWRAVNCTVVGSLAILSSSGSSQPSVTSQWLRAVQFSSAHSKVQQAPVEIRECGRGGLGSPGQPRPDQPHPLRQPDDLHLAVLRHVLVQLAGQVRLLGGVVHKQQLGQQRAGAAVQHRVDSPEQGGPGLVVEADDDGGCGQGGQVPTRSLRTVT